MADWYMSTTGDYDTLRDVPNSGSTSTAGNKVELRMDQTVTRRQVLNALAQFRRWIEQGGLNGAGANLPADRG